MIAVHDEKTRPSRRRKVRRALFTALKISGAFAAVVGTVVGVLLAHRWLTRSPHFALQEVRVSPTVHVTADAVRARSGIELGTNLFTVDLDAVTHDVQVDPWVARVRVRRELPATITIEVTEREPAAVIAFGPLYLADTRGEAFKRATPDEAASLPVITGVPRDAYMNDRDEAKALAREAMDALAEWRERPDRPAIGEVHIDSAAGVTLYTVKDGVAIRIGRNDTPTTWRERLARYDAVARSLRDSGERPRTILVDQRTRPDRVTVKLAVREARP